MPGRTAPSRRRADVLRENPWPTTSRTTTRSRDTSLQPSCLPGEVVQLCASTTSRALRRRGPPLGCDARSGLVGARRRRPRAADAARRRCRRLWLGAARRDPDRAVVAQRLLSRDDDRPRRARRPGGRLHRFRGPRRDAAARALFVLATNTWNAYNNWGGRSLYTGGKEVSFQRPWGRGMLVRPEVDREDRKSPPRRPGEEPDVDGEMYQTFRYEHGFPGYMGSAGWFTYDRRFAEWAERAGLDARLRDLERPRTGRRDHRRLPARDRRRARRVLVGGRPRRDRALRRRRRQLRLVLRQHDVLARAARA